MALVMRRARAVPVATTRFLLELCFALSRLVYVLPTLRPIKPSAIRIEDLGSFP